MIRVGSAFQAKLPEPDCPSACRGEERVLCCPTGQGVRHKHPHAWPWNDSVFDAHSCRSVTDITPPTSATRLVSVQRAYKAEIPRGLRLHTADGTYAGRYHSSIEDGGAFVLKSATGMHVTPDAYVKTSRWRRSDDSVDGIDAWVNDTKRIWRYHGWKVWFCCSLDVAWVPLVNTISPYDMVMKIIQPSVLSILDNSLEIRSEAVGTKRKICSVTPTFQPLQMV